jgi:predicted tellurium resistance membrane protein TerC
VGGVILGIMGMKMYWDTHTAPGYIAIPATLLCFAVMILAIKAWTWRIYRYAQAASSQGREIASQ